MVGKIEVILKDEVLAYLAKLSIKLFKKGYFSYLDNSDKYVDFIYDEIFKNIKHKKHIDSNRQHLKYGAYYIVITTNKRTAWHVYFNKKGNRYIINKILNNHLPSAKFLNEL